MLICNFDQDRDVEDENETEDESSKGSKNGSLDEDYEDGSTWDPLALEGVVMLQIAAPQCSSRFTILYGLLLKPVNGLCGTYRRVGLVEVPCIDELDQHDWSLETFTII